MDGGASGYGEFPVFSCNNSTDATDAVEARQQVRETHQHSHHQSHIAGRSDSDGRRRTSILGALDAVHRSLLLNNHQYECDKVDDTKSTVAINILAGQNHRRPTLRDDIEDDDNDKTVHIASTHCGSISPVNMRNPALCHSHPGTRLTTELHRHAILSATSQTRTSTAGSVTTTTTNSSFRSSSSSHHRTSDNCSSLDEASSADETPNSNPAKPQHKSDRKRRSKESRDRPMLRIVQEMSEKRAVVVSTIEVNRKKVRQWQNQTQPPEGATCSNTCRKSSESKRLHSRSRRSRQRYISENFCNEYLDKNHHQHSPPNDQHTVYTSSDNDAEANSIDASDPQHNNTTLQMQPERRQAPITFGKLQASPVSRSDRKPRAPAAGKLMAKRMARHNGDSLHTDTGSRRSSHSEVPPAKPPRTFSSYTPSVTSSTNDPHPSAALDSMTTLRIEESRQKPPANGQKVVGWKCPPDDQHAFPMHVQSGERPTAIGWAPRSIAPTLQPSQWTPPPKSTVQQHQQLHQIPQQIVDMLYYEPKKVADTTPSCTAPTRNVSLMTATQRAVPQSPPRENIDDVDSPMPSVAEPVCRIANKHMERFASGTVFSTPQRHNKNNHDRLDELRRAVEFSPSPPSALAQLHPTAPDLDEIEKQIIPAQPAHCDHCQNCVRTKTTEDRVPPKKSFGKIALRRTKTFLEAGRHMLNRKSMYQPTVAHQTQRPHSDVEVDWQQQLDCCTPPTAKVDTTARKNRLVLSNTKRTDKALNLVGREVFSDGGEGSGLVVESPRRMYERFLAASTSRQQTPPKKPARVMHAITNRQSADNTDDSQQNDFDFQRKVASPMVAHRQPGAAASPSKTGALLLLPKRLFGNASKQRPTIDLNIAAAPAPEQSSSYKSFQDKDEGFAVFMAEYLRRMYEQIQREQNQTGRADGVDELNENEDFVQLRDVSDSECSNGVDVIPDRIQWQQSAAVEEPLYSEIHKKTELNSPTYAVVNKTPSTAALSPLRFPAAKSDGNLFSQSVESLCMLNNTDDIDLVHSIEDFLGAQLLVGLRPKVGNEFKSLSEVMCHSGMRETKSTNDLESLATVATTISPGTCEPDLGRQEVQATPGNERDSPAKCEDYRQRSAAVVEPASWSRTINSEVEIYSDISSEPQLFHTAVEVHSAQTNSDTEMTAAVMSAVDDDRCSIGTYSSIVLTESICDEVLRGERMNDDICATMNRLQSVMNLTADGRYYAQAEPESSLDDGLTLDEDDDRRNCTAPPERALTTASAVPKYRQFADSVRNSIRSSSRFFKTASSTRNAEAASSPARQSAMRQNAPTTALHRSPSYMQILNDQVAHQRQLRPQLLHAITICRSSVDLGRSVELVEAERLLLLSHAKETAARSEMKRIRYDDLVDGDAGQQRLHAVDALGSAMLEIRRLEIRLQSIEADVSDAPSAYYYVCVCSYRNQVQTSEALLADHTWDAGVGDRDRRVVFDGMAMRFVDMQPNFQLKIEVFLLQLPHYATLAMTSNDGPDASRFRLLDIAFATPTNLWEISAAGAHRSGNTSLRTHSRRYEFPQCTTVSASSCIFSSTEHERLVPFASAEPFNSHRSASQRPTTTMCNRPLRLDVYSEILLDIPELKGILYVRCADDPLIGWSRQWCWIRGCKMYMSSAVKQTNSEQHLPTPPALRTIDLTHCISDRLALHAFATGAEDVPEFRHCVTIECLRGNDIDAVLTTASPSSVVYTIASTAPGDLPVWVRELNRVLDFVRDWRL